jgi:Phage P22-like portal protein
MGMFSASVGDNPNSQSGRAVLALQNQADVGSFHYVDNLALAISHCGRVLTQVWPVILDQDQIVRILGEDEEAKFVRVSPSMQQGYAEQQLPTGERRVFINPSVGKYDVRVSVGPAYQTRQLEAAAEIGEMVNGNPQMMAILGDVWVKMRNFPEADKIAKRLKAMLPPEVQQAEQDEDAELPPEVRNTLQAAAQEIEQLQQAMQAMQAELQSKQQSEELQAQVKLQIAAGQQETARYVAELQAENRENVAELTGLVQLLLQRMQPPPPLQQAVAEDL